jgi:hypothetical protein
MSTEVWFRNPDLYIREVVEVGVPRIAFDRGYAIKKRIDPLVFADIYYPAAIDWRVLMIGTQGSAEYKRGDTWDQPSAVYPTWDYSEDNLTMLEELIANPVGQIRELCTDPKVPGDERPVYGQEHIVVVVHLPHSITGPGRRMLRQLSELQAEYPDCKIYVHGLYSYRASFSHGFGAVDIEARTDAAQGHINLPNGKRVRAASTAGAPHWVTLLGMSPVDLEKPRNRCIYNIKSALWCGENFTKNVNFRVRGNVGDPEGKALLPATTKDFRTRRLPTRAGDKFACDACSLADTCKYYREGSVCSVPDSEPSQLVKMFSTRDADTIVRGMSALLGKQAERLEKGLENEEEEGGLDPEVTKIAGQLLTHGAKLAKLLNPALNGGPRVGVFVQGGNASVVQDPKRMVAGLVAELEQSGIPREKITEEMILNLMNGGAVTPTAIAGASADYRAG